MQITLEFIKIFLSALAGWLVLWGYFVVAEKWPRLLFVIAHYAISVVTFVIIGWVYMKFIRGSGFPAFHTMIYFMVSLFTIEIIFFKYVYTESLWFLNFTDWIVPVFLIASTLYLTVDYFSKS